MSKPWMPLYVGDFLADTMHLGATETGIYIRLIMHCWQHGNIPLDDRKLAMIGHCDSRLWWQYRKTVLQFFDTVDGSTAQHKRVSTELHRYAELSNKRKAAAEQMLKKKRANGQQLLTQSQSPSLKKTIDGELRSPSRAVAKATRTERDEIFEKFWQGYPKREGANPKKTAHAKFMSAVKSGVDPETILAGLHGYVAELQTSNKVGTPYVAMAVTWLNQQRWGDYAALAPVAENTGWGSGRLPTYEQIVERFGEDRAAEFMEKYYGKGSMTNGGATGADDRQPDRESVVREGKLVSFRAAKG